MMSFTAFLQIVALAIVLVGSGECWSDDVKLDIDDSQLDQDDELEDSLDPFDEPFAHASPSIDELKELHERLERRGKREARSEDAQVQDALTKLTLANRILRRVEKVSVRIQRKIRDVALAASVSAVAIAGKEWLSPKQQARVFEKLKKETQQFGGQFNVLPPKVAES